MKICDALGHAVTLNFDLLTPKSNQFISVPRCTTGKSLAKICQQILEISRKQNYHVNHGRMHGRTHGRTHRRTTQKHIASAGAYGQRRLNKNCCTNLTKTQLNQNMLKVDCAYM